ncbi:hypothetical protein [Gluconobacter cerinus]|uniref:hypothetical protein n=1 Tax=Gluconobacter cerinus TaxID=38307 RepID=UPI001B8CB6F2|nr:hypothetical protein [Gluconobacter cerinus]MBS0995868.1 hypothetical protein [Gluconobacter cerinus]
MSSTADHNANSQLIVAGSPDGADTNGCLLCLFDSTGVLNIAGISGGGSSNWINGPTGIAQYASADSPVEYIVQDSSQSTLMNLSVASYTATEVVLASTMTADQMARIHYGMYVMSNSIDPSITTPKFSAKRNLPNVNFYASTVVSVEDNTHIKVSGWAVPGAGNGATNQVPNVRTLDTSWTNFGMPTVGIGARTNTSAINWVINFTTKNTWLNNYENEIDVLGDPGLAAGRQRIHELTMTYQGPTPSADSWALNLNTYSLPVQIHMETNPTGYGIHSNSFITRGNGGVSSTVPTAEMSESAAFADGANNMRLVSWLTQDTTITGYKGVSAHTGLMVDGVMGNVGIPQAQVIYDPFLPGYSTNSTGTLAFADYDGIEFAIENSNPTVTKAHYLALQQRDWSSGSASPMLQAVSASQLNLRDTGGNGITFDTYALNVTTAITSGGLIATGDINTTGTIYATVFHENLTTPASSSAPCRAGQFTDDTNYHYVCVATNTWKRIALTGDTW